MINWWKLALQEIINAEKLFFQTLTKHLFCSFIQTSNTNLLLTSALHFPRSKEPQFKQITQACTIPLAKIFIFVDIFFESQWTVKIFKLKKPNLMKCKYVQIRFSISFPTSESQINYTRKMEPERWTISILLDV